MPLNILDYSPYVDDESEINFFNRVRGMVEYGNNWYNEMQAQKKIISRLEKFLSDRYSLVRNFTLPDEEVPIPLMLIGPQGILVMYVTDVTGIYEAKDKEWLQMNNRSNEFSPTQPNLVMRTMLFSRAVKNFLDQKGVVLPADPEPVLIFTNPGADVSTMSPAVRIVLIDALNRFATAIQTATPVMDPTQKRNIIELFKNAQLEIRTKPQTNLPFLDSLKFSTAQWIILGGMATLFLIIILIFIALILTAA